MYTYIYICIYIYTYTWSLHIFVHTFQDVAQSSWRSLRWHPTSAGLWAQRKCFDSGRPRRKNPMGSGASSNKMGRLDMETLCQCFLYIGHIGHIYSCPFSCWFGIYFWLCWFILICFKSMLHVHDQSSGNHWKSLGRCLWHCFFSWFLHDPDFVMLIVISRPTLPAWMLGDSPTTIPIIFLYGFWLQAPASWTFRTSIHRGNSIHKP